MAASDGRCMARLGYCITCSLSYRIAESAFGGATVLTSSAFFALKNSVCMVVGALGSAHIRGNPGAASNGARSGRQYGQLPKLHVPLNAFSAISRYLPGILLDNHATECMPVLYLNGFGSSVGPSLPRLQRTVVSRTFVVSSVLRPCTKLSTIAYKLLQGLVYCLCERILHVFAHL